MFGQVSSKKSRELGVVNFMLFWVRFGRVGSYIVRLIGSFSDNSRSGGLILHLFLWVLLVMHHKKVNLKLHTCL